MLKASDPSGALNRDCDQIDPAGGVGGQTRLGHIGVSEGQQTPELNWGQARLGGDRAIGTAGAYLDKNKLAALLGDQIDLANATAPVARKNLVAGPYQV
jgi:hypothetical protein